MTPLSRILCRNIILDKGVYRIRQMQGEIPRDRRLSEATELTSLFAVQDEIFQYLRESSDDAFQS